MKKISLITAWLILGGLCAQDTLILRRAFELALANNYGIRISKIDNAMAGTSNSWSGAGAFPEVNLAASPAVLSNNVNQKFINNTEIKRNNAVQKTLGASVQLNYNVLNGFKVFVTKDRLATIEKLSAQDLEQKISDIYKSIAVTYYRILSLRNTERTILSQEKTAEERVKLEETRFNLGKTGKTAFLEASLDLKDIRVLKIRQSQAITESIMELGKILMQDIRPETILSEPAGFGDLNRLASEKHDAEQSIQKTQFDLRSRIKQLEREEIKRSRYPNITVLADYHYNRLNNQAGFNLFSQSYGPSAGLSLNMPLYDGGKTSQQQKINELEQDRIQTEEDQWRREADFMLRSEKSRMLYQMEIIGQQEQKQPLAEEHLQLVRKKSELGESNSLEFTQSIFRLIEIDAVKNDARFAFMQSYINQLYLCSELDTLGR